MKLRRIPISGWRRCVHAAVAFDGEPEFRAACLIDSSERVEWWLRNDPPVFTIQTPAGVFEPDFLYRTKDHIAVLEVKGEIFWDGENSDARVKARAACQWVEAVRTSGHPEKWSFAVVLAQDASDSHSLEDMLTKALERAPE